MNDDLSVLLKVILDSSGIGSDDVTRIQKILERYTVNVTAELDKKQLMNSVNQVLPQIVKEISKVSGKDIKIDIDDSLIKKSINQVIQDGKRLERELTATVERVNDIQLSMDGKNKKSQNYDYQIDTEINKLKDLGFTDEEVSQKVKILTDAQSELKRVMNSGDFDSIVSKNKAIVEADKERTIALNQVRTAYGQLKNDASQYYNLNKQTKLSTDVQNWLCKNSRASKEAKDSLNAYYRELSNGRVSVSRLSYIEQELKKIDSEQRLLGRLGKSITEQFKEAGHSFTQWMSVTSAIMFLVSKSKAAISEIKDLDNILTEISKTSEMTGKQLKQLGMDAYDVASKYGITASDYLTGVQEMNRSGFYGEQGTGMAEQSLLAKSAGDMDSELANNYVLATNAAYKLQGNAEKINEVLDGQNSITNRNSVAMADMAESMTIAGTVASSYRVSIEDLSAMIGTMEAVTKLGGSEVGNAIKAILINLQNITSSKVVDTLDAANASMTEMVNGAEKLRNPISILRDLAKTFNQLDEDDPLRAEILTNIGQKYHANKLGALLQNMDMYDKMLVDYSEGGGSALEESNKSANNLEGSLNKLSNSWSKFVNTIVTSDGLKFGANLINDLVQGVTKLASVLKIPGILGIGSGIFNSIKNVGKPKMFGFIFCFEHADNNMCSLGY